MGFAQAHIWRPRYLGNGGYITYTYDSLDRLKEKVYNGDNSKKQIFYYEANGQVSVIIDTVNNIIDVFEAVFDNGKQIIGITPFKKPQA